MAAPFQTLCRLTSYNSINSYIVTNKRLIHLNCPKFQKKKLPKSKGVELEGFFPKTSITPANVGNAIGGSLSLRNNKVKVKNNTVNNGGIAGIGTDHTIDASEDNRINKVPTFQQILQKGYLESRRSLLVRTDNAENTMRSLASFGRINHAQYIMPDKSFVLLEFANETTSTKIKSNAALFSQSNQFPLKSRILCDTRAHNFHGKKKLSLMPPASEGNWNTKTSDYYPIQNTLAEEMECLSLNRSLDDHDLRQRFFVCMLVEDLFQTNLPNVRVIPYGSCLNGFGWWSSDLDMMLCLNDEPYSGLNMKSQYEVVSGSQFKFVTETFINDRHLAQRTLAMVASLLELMPRVQNIAKILNARVPIVRFEHEAVKMECDISIHSIDSIKMTEMLYLYSVCDPRVKPLMATIKQWAVSHSMTSGGEQQKVTTLGLLTMLIFFLQTRTPPVVPTLKYIQSLAKPSESFNIDDIKFALPGDPNIVPKSKNTESLESLLHGFFLFYSEFDFATKSISITEGQTFDKPEDTQAVCMENPLSISLNICQNVGTKSLAILKEYMKDAVLKLEDLASNDKTPGSKLSPLLSGKPVTSRLSVLYQSREQEPSVMLEELIKEESVNKPELNSDTTSQSMNKVDLVNKSHSDDKVDLDNESQSTQTIVESGIKDRL
ncbi:hypothetical protein BgiMline_026875 [Biomphalaria glabrata]|uniref:Poly(A) RNA polymerase, mitochondrial-like n=1 Tax=Biomphalaria glabrata TaxID=6526 RepID=A0A9W2YD58_BIOGL|nr:poly(A) RNA polymerase, mitochondrial-like [Biomphalaria glabrata]KAI8744318.1 poly(A) RNA polymerase; mitochondrial [Biomphalaria glabrata]